MHSTVLWQYLSPNGRSSRASFLFAAGISSFLFFLLSWLLPVWGLKPGLWLHPPYFLLMLLLCMRRLHDTGLRAWVLLVVLLPVLGPVWLAWRLCCKRGMRAENRFGADPLADAGDYLVVK